MNFAKCDPLKQLFWRAVIAMLSASVTYACLMRLMGDASVWGSAVVVSLVMALISGGAVIVFRHWPKPVNYERLSVIKAACAAFVVALAASETAFYLTAHGIRPVDDDEGAFAIVFINGAALLAVAVAFHDARKYARARGMAARDADYVIAGLIIGLAGFAILLPYNWIIASVVQGAFVGLMFATTSLSLHQCLRRHRTDEACP